jgi:hypothetical protein
MRRTPGLLALIGLAATGIPALSLPATAPAGVTPIQGSRACKPTPPHVIAAGGDPRAPLRLDLAAMAHHTQAAREVETFARRTRLLDGKWHPTTAIRKITAVAKVGAITGTQIGVTAKYTTSFPSTKTTAGAKGGTFTLKGRTDAKSGGFLGGSAGNDRFPDAPIGIGARWSVVNCDAVDDDVPAKQVRTYTLHSLAHGTAVLSYREVISIDAAHRDLGTQTIAKEKVHVRLDLVRGSSTGSVRIPLAAAFEAESTQVTKLEITYHLVGKNLPATPIHGRVIDTRKDRAVA